MEVEFETMFADELDAMNDLDDSFPSTPAPKSKKSLAFTTPKVRSQNLDDSILPSLDDSPVSTNVTQVTPSKPISCSLSSRKRKEYELFGPLSDDEPEEDAVDGMLDLPGIEPRRKKQRTQNSGISTSAAMVTNEDDYFDDFAISPPPSPDKPKSKDIRSYKRNTNLYDIDQEYHDRIMANYDYERQHLLTRMPDTDFISLTSGKSGKRYYLAQKDEEDLTQELNTVASASRSVQLLTTPYYELKIQVEDDKRKRIVEESERLTRELLRREQEERDEIDDEVESRDELDFKLWVELYTPRAYTDLLSDESTNRTLLSWIKLWDYVVFGKDKPIRKTAKIQVKTKADGKKEFVKRDYRKEQMAIEEELDSLNRPKHKVVMLCGPPGLGKTTLAHVIARHAGYCVVEINASDDRSAELFKNKVESSIQMQAVIGDDCRPNCLVIDEIDGAPAPAINHLIAQIKAGEGESKSEHGEKKKKKKQPLLRPIICICNDQYAPSLKNLRPLSLLLHFPPTLTTRLASRLLEISRKERLRADLTTLLALCTKSDNDIRSCVNTLQFVKGQKHELTMRDVQSASIGQKDLHKSFIEVWKSIFTLPRASRTQYINPYDRNNDNRRDLSDMVNQNSTSMTSRFFKVLSVVQATGEYEKITQGMFDNYLEMRVKDPRMESINTANDWLAFVDQINQRIQKSQDYSTMRYIPFLMVSFHLLFAATNVPRIQYPKSAYENHLKMTKCSNLVTALLEDMVPGVRHFLNGPTVVTDLLPPLLDILQPSLRPVNTQLYSAREKADMMLLVKIMIAYNLTYRQEKSMEGTYNYSLEPRVDEVVRFPGMKQKRQMTYVAKQLIAREIDLEKMRQNDRREPSFQMPNKSGAMKKASDPKTVSTKAQVVPNHMKKLEPKAVPTVKEDDVSKDFFGRTVEKPTHIVTKKKKSDDAESLLSGSIWFHFKEGYSNAVRRTIRIQDLL